jgi:hypothetical protein
LPHKGSLGPEVVVSGAVVVAALVDIEPLVSVVSLELVGPVVVSSGPSLVLSACSSGKAIQLSTTFSGRLQP